MYDGIALTTKLSKLGFDVYTAYDCNTHVMNDVLADFSRKAGSYDVALFYYSGHGVQEKNINYLIPVNRNLKYRTDLEECVKCELVKELFEESKCKSRLLYFDACRSPKSWTRDVSEEWGHLEGDMGTYITFSTRSGEVAFDGEDKSNSPFAISLLKYIDEPEDFQLVMRKVAVNTNEITNQEQTPVTTGYLRDAFCFNPAKPTPAQVVAVQPAPATATSVAKTTPSQQTTAKTTKQKTIELGEDDKAEIIYLAGIDEFNLKNYNEAVKSFRKSADLGYAKAQKELGSCYEYGLGVAQDGAEAVKWFLKAAEQGDAQAQCSVARCYEFGRKGVEKNPTVAVKWYQKSAENGYVPAQYYLAKHYVEGYGNIGDINEGIKWYRKAAENGNPSAQLALGEIYEKGNGVKINIEEAIKWYQMAAACNILDWASDAASRIKRLKELSE